MIRILIINKNRQQFIAKRMLDNKNANRRYRQSPQRSSNINISTSMDNKGLPAIALYTPNKHKHRNSKHNQQSIPIHFVNQQVDKEKSNTCIIDREVNSSNLKKQKVLGILQAEEKLQNDEQSTNYWVKTNYSRIKYSLNKDRHNKYQSYLKIAAYNQKNQDFQLHKKASDQQQMPSYRLHQGSFKKQNTSSINEQKYEKNQSHLGVGIQISQKNFPQKNQNRYLSINNNRLLNSGFNYNQNYSSHNGTPHSKNKLNISTDLHSSNNLAFFRKVKAQQSFLNHQFQSIIPKTPHPISSSAFEKTSKFDQNELNLISIKDPIPIHLSNSPKQKKIAQSISYFAESFKGRRPYNQDRYICQVKVNNNLRNKLFHLSQKIQMMSNKNNIQKTRGSQTSFLNSNNKYSLFGVFDGHGGSKCSQFLKQNFSEVLSLNKNLFSNPNQALKQTFQKLQQKFVSLCQKKGHLQTSGSCAVVCLIHDTKIYTSNLGDSRAILIGKKQILQITKDHKPEDKDQRARIIRYGGKLYKDGSILGCQGKQNIRIFNQTRIIPGNLNVSRTFGDIQIKLKKFGGLPGIVVAEPQIFTHSLAQDFPYLIIASDGLFQGLKNQQIHNIFKTVVAKKFQNTEQLVQNLTKQLIKKASQKSNDNITVICVKLPVSQHQSN